MKKLLCLLSIVGLFACSNPGKFKLNGTISGIKNDRLVIGTFSRVNNALEGIDTINVVDGTFTYSLPTIETSSYSFKLLEADLAFSSILENGDLTLIVNSENASRGYIQEVDLKGSVNNQLLEQFHNVKDVVMDRPEFAKCKEINGKMMTAYEAKDYKAYEEYKKEYGNISADLDKAVWKEQRNLLEKHIDQYFVIQVFPFLKGSASLEELQTLYAALPESSKKHRNVISVKEDIDAKACIQPGKPAPDFTLLTNKEEELTLSSLKGKYVLIDFWASWCKPCRESFPHMKELYAKYKGKGFEILAVTNDSKKSMWLNAIEEDQTPWLHVADEFPKKFSPARVISMYGMDYLPSTVLIDPNGLIVEKLLHGHALDDKLKEIFGF